MIPVEQLTALRARAASNGFTLQVHPLVTKLCVLRVVPGNVGCSSRLSSQQPTLRAIYSPSRTTLLSFQFLPPNYSNLSSARRGRGWRRSTDIRWSLGSSPLSTSDVAATGEEAESSYEVSSQCPQERSQESQNSGVLSSSGSVGQDETAAMEAENSAEDDGGGRVQRTVTVLTEANQEDGAEMVVQEEYKLAEDGSLSTVTVTRGEKTLRTNTKMERVLAEVGIKAETLQNKIQNFSVRKFIEEWGKKKPELQDLKFNAAMYEPVGGISNITQWTATELTLQRGQLVRIARDASYLVWAFTLFGGVRILEAVVAVFKSSPPDPWKLMDCMNALDPLTVASLAYALRKPIVGMLDVDPTNLEEVSGLKSKFWAELHKFFERQWKVIATLGVARLLSIIVTHLPNAQWVTSKIKVLWDISMALPVF